MTRSPTTATCMQDVYDPRNGRSTRKRRPHVVDVSRVPRSLGDYVHCQACGRLVYVAPITDVCRSCGRPTTSAPCCDEESGQ